MKLPPPPPSYSPVHLREVQRQIEAADNLNRKIDGDIEVAGGKIVLTASDGSRWVLTVATDGTLSTVSA